MTESENPDVLTTGENERNHQLQFDSEWDSTSIGSNCHVCLKIDWESSTSRCVCSLINFTFIQRLNSL